MSSSSKRSLFLTLQNLVIFSIAGELLDANYTPVELIPDGYVMWVRVDENSTLINSYLISRTKLCQTRIEDGWLRYRIIDVDQVVSDDDGLFKTTFEQFKNDHGQEGVWRKLLEAHHIHIDSLLCFWYNGGPNVIVRDSDKLLHLIMLGKDAGMWDFTLRGSIYPIFAYNVIYHAIYAHIDGYLYRIAPKDFIDVVKTIDFSLREDIVRFPPINVPFLLRTKTEDWDDMLVQGNHTYYLLDNYLYMIEGRNEILVKRYETSDNRFKHIIVPTYEDELHFIEEDIHTVEQHILFELEPLIDPDVQHVEPTSAIPPIMSDVIRKPVVFTSPSTPHNESMILISYPQMDKPHSSKEVWLADWQKNVLIYMLFALPLLLAFCLFEIWRCHRTARHRDTLLLPNYSI